jgi:transcriptional regulator with XRE-family HTH domain
MAPRALKQADSEPIDTTSIAVGADGRAGRRDDENLGLIVGHNIKRLRHRRNLSMEGLAKLSGVSRAMLGQIELGRSVPTINVVWKIARAFDVPFSTLIANETVKTIRVLPVNETKILTSATGDFSSRALFPFDGERSTEFYELRLKPGCIEYADAHAIGTMENIVVSRGALEIEIGNDISELGAGDAVLFQADVPHAYKNVSKGETVAYLVMTYVEPAG